MSPRAVFHSVLCGFIGLLFSVRVGAAGSDLCRSVNFEGNDYTVCEADLRQEAIQREAVFGLEAIYPASALTLPRALPANVVGDDLVEGATVAEHKHVHVGDGAEALVAHVRLMAVCARWDWKTAPEGANS